MQAFMRLKGQRRRALSKHPFIQWLNADNVPIERKLLFAPIMAVFVMNFRDMNKWVLRFDESNDRFKEILNGNTFEDETHSRLFLEDWRKLDLDRILRWRTSDLLSWLFLARQTEPFRRYGVEFIRLCVDDKDDPLVRFAHSEAGEACGHVFFEHVVKPTVELSQRTGRSYRYFGHHHLDRELGHVMESEGVFENEVLDPGQRQRTIELGTRMFDIFDGIFDAFHSYAQKHVAHWNIPDRADTSMRLPGYRGGFPRFKAIAGRPAFGHDQLIRLLADRKRRTAAHPFFTWLRNARDVPPIARLQRFMAMWSMDIMGYRDLNHYVFRYQDPRSDQERAINDWVADLETHQGLYLADWDALGMDHVLGWTSSEAMEFLFLDPHMDVHRRNIVRFAQLGLKHTDPVLRYWLMHALESSGHAFFENTRAVALDAEREHGCSLNYLADRHELAHARSASPDDDIEVPFMEQPMTAQDLDIAAEMITTVFDAVDEQLTLSLDVAANNRFNVGVTPHTEPFELFHRPTPRTPTVRPNHPAV